jgi:Bacterial Ig-like domain (group 3)
LSGTPVNLTATVSGSGATPTGNVTFSEGGTTLGTASLSSGQGTLSVNSLPVGLLPISASYSGDTNFLGCTAPIITLTVNKNTTTTAVTSSLNPPRWAAR